MTAVLVFNFVISYRTVGWTKPYRRGWQALAGQMAGLLAEMVGNIATVRSFGGEPAVKARYDRPRPSGRSCATSSTRPSGDRRLALNIANALAVFLAVALIAAVR